MLELKSKTSKNIDSQTEKMLKAGVHFGYSRSRRHPKIMKYIFGQKNNVEIFSLEKTKQKLEEAKEFLKNLGKENKKIVLLGTKMEIRQMVKKLSEEIGASYVNRRWIGGTFTNFKTVKGRINHMIDLVDKKKTGELDKYTKKEQLTKEKEIEKLKAYFSGLEKMENLPSGLVVVDSSKEKNAVAEARIMSIPVVAIVNTDCNPEDADYPIPANDNSISSVEYILKELVDAYKDGLKEVKNI